MGDALCRCGAEKTPGPDHGRLCPSYMVPDGEETTCEEANRLQDTFDELDIYCQWSPRHDTFTLVLLPAQAQKILAAISG